MIILEIHRTGQYGLALYITESDIPGISRADELSIRTLLSDTARSMGINTEIADVTVFSQDGEVLVFSSFNNNRSQFYFSSQNDFLDFLNASPPDIFGRLSVINAPTGFYADLYGHDALLASEYADYPETS